MDLSKAPAKSPPLSSNSIASTVLSHCIYVIQSVGEFKNLSYRLSKTHANLEVLIVYREGACSILGPPLDPISLTLDPSGRCLVNVLFKPVQRVNFVSKDSGAINSAALKAVLRLISGKGYLFCPGIPEKLLAGKACGKYITPHRIPFKRFQSVQCGVYYQPPASHPRGKSPLCSLCPACLQAVKLVQLLPFLPALPDKPVTQSPQPAAVGIYKPAHTEEMVPVSRDGLVAYVDKSQPIVSGVPPSDKLSPQNSLAKVNNNGQNIAGLAILRKEPELTIEPLKHQAMAQFGNTVVHQYQSANPPKAISGNTESVERLSMPVEPASQVTAAGKRGEQHDGPVDRPVNSKLLHLLREKGAHKSRRVTKANLKTGKNMCHICLKHFSSHDNLQSHILRHEGLSVSRCRRKRLNSVNKISTNISSSNKASRSASILRTIARRQNLLKSNSNLSGMSMRIIQKCVKDIMPEFGIENKLGGQSSEVKRDVKEGLQLQPLETCDGVHSNRLLKRSTSGPYSVQTLLEAAAFTSLTSSDGFTESKESHQWNGHDEFTDEYDFPPDSKKPRKSSRIASKKVKGRRRRKGSKHDSDVQSDVVSVPSQLHVSPPLPDPSVPTTDSPMVSPMGLTNLNLLSTVSLEKAMREKPGANVGLNDQSQIGTGLSSSVGQKGARLPVIKISDYIKVTTASQLLNSHVVFPSLPNNQHTFALGGSRSVGPASIQLTPTASLPPLPPLLFAGNINTSTYASSSISASAGLVPTSTLLTSTLASMAPGMKSTPETPDPSMITRSSNHNTAGFECGAMDLSKPKENKVMSSTHSTTLPNVLPDTVKALPQSVAQYIFLLNKNPPETSDSIAAHNASAKMQDAPSGKKQDSELQARMFASAREYKLEKNKESTSHVQSIIASTTRPPVGGHSATRDSAGNKVTTSSVSGDEIQCGYKWSGSGGVVKERTQRIRELVPKDVMTNILSRPPSVQLPGTPVQVRVGISPQSSHMLHKGTGSGRGVVIAPMPHVRGIASEPHRPVFGTGKGSYVIEQRPSNVHRPSGLEFQRAVNPSTHMVLNLSTAARPPETISQSSSRKRAKGSTSVGKGQETVQDKAALITPMSSALPAISPMPLSPRGLLRTSLMYPRSMVTQLLSQQNQPRTHPPLPHSLPRASDPQVPPPDPSSQLLPSRPLAAEDANNSQPQALNLVQQHPPSTTTANFFTSSPITSNLPPSPISNISSTSTSGSRAISSPSLAAILRQQPVSITSADENGTNFLTSAPTNSLVKEEPKDNVSAPNLVRLHESRVIMSLPVVKRETPESVGTETVSVSNPEAIGWRQNSQPSRDSPPALVMDISTEDNSNSSSSSTKCGQDVKCEYCKTTFPNSYHHVCSQRLQNTS